MAKKKKSRVPTPPKSASTRPVQAPKAYHATRDPRRTRMLFIAIGALILLAGAGVGIAMAVGRGGSGAIDESAVCNLQTFPSAGRNHVDKRPPPSAYNSNPPTSGPHFAQPRAPVVWNVYEEPLDQVSLVHNLEHGGMVIQYGSGVSDADVQRLRDWYGKDALGLVLAPLPPSVEKQKPELKNEIAVTAWTHLMTCSAFDEAAMDDFSDRFRGPQGDAPEKFPLEALQPGGQ